MDKNEFEIVYGKNNPSGNGDGSNFYVFEPIKKTKKMELKVLKTKEEQPSLQEAQEYVGGLVQLLPIENDAQMLVNEEGLMHELEVNYPASFAAGQVILGPAMILEGEAKWD